MSTPKLTKKQQKGLAFRQRKQVKGSRKDVDREEDLAFPIPEDQVVADQEEDQGGSSDLKRSTGEKTAQVSKQDKKGKQKDGTGTGPRQPDSAEKSKKRKRGVEAGAEEARDSSPPKPKKSRRDVQEGSETKAVKGQQRYILFIGAVPYYSMVLWMSLNVYRAGNLRYTTTQEAILSHFSVCGAGPSLSLE